MSAFEEERKQQRCIELSDEPLVFILDDGRETITTEYNGDAEEVLQTISTVVAALCHDLAGDVKKRFPEREEDQDEIGCYICEQVINGIMSDYINTFMTAADDEVDTQ